MNIPTLIEKYGRLNRTVGDYRACLLASDLGTSRHKDARIALDRAIEKLTSVENTLEDMGLLNASDRHTDRGEA